MPVSIGDTVAIIYIPKFDSGSIESIVQPATVMGIDAKGNIRISSDGEIGSAIFNGETGIYESGNWEYEDRFAGGEWDVSRSVMIVLNKAQSEALLTLAGN